MVVLMEFTIFIVPHKQGAEVVADAYFFLVILIEHPK